LQENPKIIEIKVKFTNVKLGKTTRKHNPYETNQFKEFLKVKNVEIS